MPHLNANVYRFVAWAGVAVLVVSLPALAWLGTWRGVLVALAFIVITAAFVHYEPRLPTLFDALFAWAAVINAGGYIWDFYPLIPYYDVFVHFCTTFAGTLAFGYLSYHAVAHAFRNHRFLFVIAITSFGLAAGALWEVFEWLIDFIGPVPDTVADLSVDLLGAFAAALLSTLALPPGD